ncbi:MAG: hypothetical protein K6G61_12100 [Solobacterium sp.]|nr:hypothetical protein [Solobacterium sp.]
MRKEVRTAFLCALFALSACSEKISSSQASSQTEDKPAEHMEFENEVIFDIMKEGTGASGYYWDIEIENLTGKTLYFSMENVTINGVVADPMWGIGLAAEERKAARITWAQGLLDTSHIEKVTAAEFDLCGIDEKDEFKEVFKEHISIYPEGKEAAKEQEYTASEGETVMIDSDDMLLIIQKPEEAEVGYSAEIYMENRSDKELFLQSSDETTVNGSSANPYWFYQIPAGKKAYSRVYILPELMDETAELNAIELFIEVFANEEMSGEPLMKGSAVLK